MILSGTCLVVFVVVFNYNCQLTCCNENVVSNSTLNTTLPTSKGSDHLRVRSGYLNHVEELILTVHTRKIKVFNITAEDLEYLNNLTELAYFGDGNETVRDVRVRNSKFTSTFDLNLNLMDVAKEIGIDDKIIKPYKLNLYNEGCFFNVHRDTPRHGLVGTLILILPTTYTGGNIIFGNFNLEETMPKGTLRFIYFDIGLEHLISRVTSGHRITLVYNVFNPSSKAFIKPKVHFNEVHQVVYENLLEEAIQFCKNKTNILLGYHKYRNDIFYKLVEDLKKHFEIIEVAVEKEGVANISDVRDVYVVKEPIDQGDAPYLRNDAIKTYARKKYEVKHVLFPLATNLNANSWSLSNYIGRHRGNDAEYEEEITELEFFTAFLINPSRPTKVEEFWGDDDDDDDDDDDY